jgi:hypothetical protein
MAQGDINIANQGFPSFRADLNDQLEALVTNSSGATEPSTTYPYQWWMDTSTTPNTLRQRNGANDAWIEVGTFDQSANEFVPNGALVLTGDQDAGGVKNFTGNIQLSGSQVYARSNILDTVSQSGGVPTGGIIERGSNANGEFVKYADGTVHMSLAYPYTTGSVNSLVFEDPVALPTTVINFVEGTASVADLFPSAKAFVIHSPYTGGSSETNADRVKVLFGASVPASDTVRLVHRAVFSNSGNLQTALVFVEGRWF